MEDGSMILNDTPCNYEDKTAEQRETLIHGLRTNRYCKYLDASQQENFVNAARLVEFSANEYITKQGTPGDCIYVMEDGEAEVYFETHKNTSVPIQTRRKGESFGHQAVLFELARSVSVQATTPVKVWAVSKTDFRSMVLRSESLERLFLKYASIKAKDGERLMSARDFMQSILPTLDDQRERVHLQLLTSIFEIIDKHGNGSLSYDEFALFNAIVSKPDAEFDVAFLLFNKDRQGFINKETFIKVLTTQLKSIESLRLSKPSFKFNTDTEMMKRFFGKDGKRVLRFLEFSEFFIALQAEIPRQLFEYYDNEGDGYIEFGDFKAIMLQFGSWQMAQGIVDRVLDLHHLRKCSPGDCVSYPEFYAFMNMLDHLPSIEVSIQHASFGRTDSRIPKEDFMTAAKKVFANMSPTEAEIVYTLFDLSGDGKISLEDFHLVMANSPLVKRPVAEREKIKQNAILKHATDAITNFCIGAVAGAIGATGVYPIDLVKTRMQDQRSTENLYKNSFDCFRKVIQREGVKGLYRGLTPQLVGVAPEKAIKLTINDLLRSVFADPAREGHVSLPLEILAGACAGTGQVIVTNPLELVKLRLQLQGQVVAASSGSSLPRKSALSIVRELGFRGLYTGSAACLMRDIPFSAIYFPTYAFAKTWLIRQKDEDILKSSDLLMAGALAGVPAASLTTPADVIKTRLQAERRSGTQSYGGIADCFKTIIRTEGLSALFKGAGARVFRSSPQFGITLFSYEVLQRWIAPNIKPRAPTNAPVLPSDLDLIRRQDTMKRLRRLDTMFENLLGGTPSVLRYTTVPKNRINKEQ